MNKGIQYFSIYFLLVPLMALLIAASANSFDKVAYYKTMESGKLAAIDAQIKAVEADAGVNRDAFTGALLMRKAGMVKGLSKKLNTFKKGHKKLEAAIKAEHANAEFRFLRLIIQENAPKMLGYHSEIDDDASIIHKNFPSFPAELKEAVLNYRKQSPGLQKLNF